MGNELNLKPEWKPDEWFGIWCGTGWSQNFDQVFHYPAAEIAKAHLKQLWAVTPAGYVVAKFGKDGEPVFLD